MYVAFVSVISIPISEISQSWYGVASNHCGLNLITHSIQALEQSNLSSQEDINIWKCIAFRPPTEVQVDWIIQKCQTFLSLNSQQGDFTFTQHVKFTIKYCSLAWTVEHAYQKSLHRCLIITSSHKFLFSAAIFKYIEALHLHADLTNATRILSAQDHFHCFSWNFM